MCMYFPGFLGVYIREFSRRTSGIVEVRRKERSPTGVSQCPAGAYMLLGYRRHLPYYRLASGFAVVTISLPYPPFGFDMFSEVFLEHTTQR